jgi:diguanylate cyclase (GGDEF)-like protein
MRFIISARAIFSVPADNPELTRSQFAALARQIPLLYFILVVSTTAVCFTFFNRTPRWLGLYMPGALCIVCTLRAFRWWHIRRDTMPHEDCVRLLQKTVRLTVLFGIAYTAWALQLYQYGDAYTRAHVAFYMSITVIGCIFCLMHLRPAALLLTGIVVVPWTVFFCVSRQPVFISIAVNLVLVAIAMVVILFINYRDFANLISSQRQLVLQQLETQALSDAHSRVANLDSLTGLPNRRSFFSSLDTLLRQAKLNDGRFIIGLIDLDGFKQVNDAFGHAFGDLVLIQVARKLGRLATVDIQIARLGGDEFGLLIERNITNAQVMKLGELFCNELRGDLAVRDISISLACSAGFAVFPEAGITSEQLFERADYAMYYAKKHASGQAIIFSSNHETQIRRSSLIEQELRIAISAKELGLAFQPVVDMQTGTIKGFEALARWENAQLGTVPPDEFIQIAERSDLINGVTETLLDKALTVLSKLQEDVYMSFNLSTRDITSSRSIDWIINAVKSSKITPSRIEFEITETAIMSDFNQAHASLTALRAMGARIALDDFGSGYSSLSYVHRLPLDKIKLDRSFIADIECDEGSLNIVSTIISMCRQLRVDCVVEGVETESQKSALLALGCTVGQGFYFAAPMTEAAALASVHIPHRRRRVIGATNTVHRNFSV